ncbi:hypothetical protein AKJ64_01930, partial [candidate division MSBL1 archaeon SCGC-AAA259E17]
EAAERKEAGEGGAGAEEAPSDEGFPEEVSVQAEGERSEEGEPGVWEELEGELEEPSRASTWQPEEAGDQLLGEITRTGRGPNGRLLEVQTPEGENYVLWERIALKDLFDRAEAGDRIGDMGDIAFQETEDVERIIREMIVPNPHTFFLLMTKSPGTYERFLDKLPENVILSATIETNRDYDLSKAPNTSERKARMESLEWPTKHVCVEPILDFDVSTFVDWIREIDPVLVTIGYDNYSCGLPEPFKEKTLDFAERISDFTAVHKKEIRETSPKEGANRTNR